MEETVAHPWRPARSLDLPAWKALISHVSAGLVALLFISSGVWKIVDPFTWRTMVEQLLVPIQFSMPLAIGLGITEAFAGVLILVPRFRRWGAYLAAALLVVFMVYMAVNYSTLAGKDCSCFPWVKRTVSPGFFVGDVVMLLLAGIAAWWARPSWGVRNAAVILGAIAVFSAVSYGVNATRLTGTRAPDTIVVDGKTESLQHGRVFLYFYDPQCTHCEAAARTMSKFDWDGTRVISLPTAEPRYAASFLRDTGFKAGTSLEAAPLKKIFPFGDPPFGVALENGREKGPVSQYSGNEPETTLRKLGMIR